MDDSRQSIHPRVLGEILAKRKWHLLLPLLVVIGGSIFLIESLPKIYSVQSTILFESQTSLTRDVQSHLLPGSRSSGSQRRDDRMEQANLLRMKVLAPEFLGNVAEEMGVLENPDRLEQAAEKKRLTGDPKSVEAIVREDATGWLGSLIEINLAGPSVYQVTIEGRHPRFLYELAERINADLFEMVQGEELSRIRAASDFTDEQMRLYKDKVDEAQRELDRFLETHRVSDQGEPVTRVDPNVVDRLAEETGFEILRITEDLQETRAILEQSYGYRVEDFQETVSPEIALRVERLVSLEKQLGFLLLERSWNDPSVIAHNSRIGGARQEIRDALERSARTLLAGRPGRQQELAATAAFDRVLIGSLESRKGALMRQTSPGGGGLSPSAISRRDQQLQFLEEQVRINEEIYRSFVRQATSTRISEAVESEQLNRSLQVIKPPRWPSSPVRPNKPQLYALAVVLGIALGSALVIAGEYMDTSVKDVRDAEELVGAPILGTIPKIEFRFEPDPKNRLRRGLIVTIVGGILIGALIGWFIFGGGGDEGNDGGESARESGHAGSATAASGGGEAGR
ncbi:MAG: hypothetical protein JW958_11105 [Candidatus Eisenbacteria bacterium]|nr:hypothetical protein [Candidatus Eisenbacteria bacterium]